MIIAHRCNLNGPSENENTVGAMLECIGAGFLVEIDIHLIDSKLFIGHDLVQEFHKEIDIELLLQYANKLFIHCKNIEALLYLRGYNELCVFGHSLDEFVLTSHLDVFCGVGIARKGCICVMPELHTRKFSKEELEVCQHILTDFPYRYKNEIDSNSFGQK